MGKSNADESPARIGRLFERFIDSEYAFEKFADALYRALHITASFGFIAHYDRRGFFAERFASPAARLATFTTMMVAEGGFAQ